MLLREDFKHVRVITNNKLQRFPANSLPTANLKQNAQRKSELGYLEYMKGELNKYAALSSMHGINRIFESNSTRCSRATWSLGLLLCLLVFVYVSYHVAHKYQLNPLVTVVSDTDYPIFRIPFPEVTICNKNRLNWRRFKMAQSLFLKEQHQLIPQYQKIFFEAVNAYDTLAFGQFHKFENLSMAPPSILKELSYVDFKAVAEFMAWKCHEIFSNCRWLDDEYSCCSIFFKRNSQMGACLAFNTIESADGLSKQRHDPFWPWRTKEPGIFNGLSVRIHLREQDHSPLQNNKKGILVMLAEPSIWFSSSIEIDTHTQTSISIDGVLYSYSNYTRVFSPRVRECLFQDELNSQEYRSLANRTYMFENCQSQCELDYIFKYCNCTFSLFYPQNIYRPCTASDLPCLFYHNEKFQNFEHGGESEYVYRHNYNAMKCSCLYNCHSVQYHETITTAYMSNLEVNFNNSFIDLNVFFQNESIIAYLTTVLYTLPDLMASFGGLAGLCVGCSLLSFVEFAYFLIIDLTHKTLIFFKNGKQWRWRRKSWQVKVHILDNFTRH